ncbi:uncharacterized protein FFB20_13586 [Fusarium fujikuroi]|uniref:Uncharacterized protein n=2 Tax=Fusarium fujikuroi TaxID=5127 RepID=S0EP85_GIBF5|nr:uncharacterized protein FFUJ_14147 [Fusarium fujikuroi IMI 58289]KLP18066.1 uncharacterized protein LW94_14727 [Fusarium fujikuroi]QGI88731.1 hypothetical protein CEK25_003687 [Fusarium fujikuroi]CCT76219.1 uncharacterized protein FFUJ_14147 [Fusarium fujikuroi IMI 58289]SCO10617.1 uncharacterized protein FFB20_13586 [Fusarium fujikuroi]SCO23870.1 uncharacterized protein FFE2_15788 [Fusarium fujikuroi]
MTNRTERSKRMEKLHRRDRELRRFFVVHVRYGGSNPWGFNTGDLYYMIKFCPLSEVRLHEHHRDPIWINDYQGMLNIREKWRVSMKKYHGDLPENYEGQIFRVDSKREPLIEEGMAGYFQPERRLEQKSLYLPPPHHQPATLPLPEAQEEERGKDHTMPPPQPARLPSLQNQPAFPLPP